jgi:hypothetical protein
MGKRDVLKTGTFAKNYMSTSTQFKEGHEKIEGSGRPKGAITQCKEIRAQRRENAMKYVLEQQERLAALEEHILEDTELRAAERYKLLIDIERIRQQEVTLSVPGEQNLKIEDEAGVKSSRQLLMEKMEALRNTNKPQK